MSVFAPLSSKEAWKLANVEIKVRAAVVLVWGSSEARSQYSGSVVEVVVDMVLYRFSRMSFNVKEKKKKKLVGEVDYEKVGSGFAQPKSSLLSP
jgi:hypothetical protein